MLAVSNRLPIGSPSRVALSLLVQYLKVKFSVMSKSILVPFVCTDSAFSNYTRLQDKYIQYIIYCTQFTKKSKGLTVRQTFILLRPQIIFKQCSALLAVLSLLASIILIVKHFPESSLVVYVSNKALCVTDYRFCS